MVIPTSKHIHTYIRWKRKNGSIWYKCDDPTCTHALPKDAVLGKQSICAVCHANELILTSEALRRAKPRCSQCSGRQEDVRHREIESKLENIFKIPGSEEENRQ